LAGTIGDRVLQLRSPFGGGKSHLLLALCHAGRGRKALLAGWPAAAALPDPGVVRVAAFAGETFDVQGRDLATGSRVTTLWGWLALQLGGATVNETVAKHDQLKIAPGRQVLARLERG